MTSPKIYRVVDVRADGALRVVGAFTDPREARAALDALRNAGAASADVEIIQTADPLADAGATT